MYLHATTAHNSFFKILHTLLCSLDRKYVSGGEILYLISDGYSYLGVLCVVLLSHMDG